MPLAFTSLQSCDPGTEYDQVIENNSRYDILVMVNNSLDYVNRTYESDSFLVAKHSVVSIYKHLSLGTLEQFENCEIYADSLTAKIQNFDSLKLTLDINNTSNWTYSIFEVKGRGGVCECRIEIKDENIE